MNQNVLIGIVVAILVLGGIIYFATNSNDDIPGVSTEDIVPNTNTNSTTTNGTNTTPNTSNTNTNNSTTARNSVTLAELSGGNTAQASVVAREAGFVAVYRVNSLGSTSFVGASSKLTAGTHNNVSIQLTSPLVDGETIVAVLHTDTNNNGRFDEDGADAYMTLSNQMALDVDVIGVPVAEEDADLEASVETFLERNATSS